MIQVKTTSGARTRVGWHMSVRHESIKDKDLFYCFVNLSDSNAAVYVVAASVVARVIKTGHANWLKTPGLNGRQRNDNDMRMISNSPRTQNRYAPVGWMDKCLEAWELLA